MERVTLERVPPQNVDAERCVLGAMLLPDESQVTVPEVLAVLCENDYYKLSHQKIHAAIESLFKAGEKVDIITASQMLESGGNLESAGGLAYLDELQDSVPTAANVKYYAGIVKEYANRRKLITISAKTYNECYDLQMDYADLVGDAEREILSLRSKEGNSGLTLLKYTLKDTFKHVQALYEKQEKIIGLSTGFLDLDRITAGFQKGEYIVIAGRPSMGKSTFVQNIIQHNAIDMKVPTLIFSLEMSSLSLTLRFLSSESDVAFQRMRTGFISDEEWPKIVLGASRLSESPIVVDDTTSLTTSELRAKCHQAKSAYDIGLIVVDYLQLLKSNSRRESKQQEITDISADLKGIGRSLDVPMVVCSQLSRAPEARNDKRPQLSDLRESGSIEQDADVVLFLYRDNYYNKESSDSTTEVIIGKQRNGPLGTVKLGFLPSSMRFVNLERRFAGAREEVDGTAKA